MKHVNGGILCSTLFLLSSVMVAGEPIDVAPVSPGKQLFFRHGKKCILRSKDFGDAIRVRIFRGTPDSLASQVPSVGATCVDISSIVGIVVPDSGDLDLEFYFTLGWLTKDHKHYAPGEYSFILERVPRPKVPAFVEFTEQRLHIPADQVKGYFASAIHVTVQAPDSVPHKKKGTSGGPLMPKPPDPRPAVSKVVDCSSVTYTKPVTLEANKPTIRPAKTAGTAPPTNHEVRGQLSHLSSSPSKSSARE